MKPYTPSYRRFATLKTLAITGITTFGLSTCILAAEKNSAPTVPLANHNSATETLEKWDDQLFSEMHKFEKRMDDLFSNVRLDIGGTTPSVDTVAGNFNSSVKLTDTAHQYVIRFALPNTEMEKANVTLKDGILHVTANEQSETYAKWEANPKSNTSKKEAQQTHASTSIHYEQLISLPGPVDSASMKVQRSAGLVTVTLTKTGDHPSPATENKK